MEIKTNAFSTAVSGIQRAEADVGRAAADLNKALADNQNAVATPPPADADDDVVVVSDEAAVAAAVQAAAVPAEGGDIITPLVDIMKAKTAYQANAAALKVTSDVEGDLAKLLKSREA